MGLNIGVISLIGRFVGAKDMARTDEVMFSGFLIALGYSSFLAVCFVIFREPLVNVFVTPVGDFEEIRKLSTFMMVGMASYVMADAVILISGGVLRGAGDTRWLMFSSIIQAIALSIANTKNCPVEIAMGIHAGDHAIYPDCRQEFRDADYEAFKQGNWDADQVTYTTPYLDGDKFDILKDGEVCCKKLNLDFDEVYKRTNTSYKPTAEGLSDYKSASSVERIEAFLKLGRKDPVEYVDGWMIAKEHVTALLAAHE